MEERPMARSVVLVRSVIALVAIALTLTASAAAAGPRDPFTGAWKLDDGDGSTSYYFFGAPAGGAVRQFQLFDSYATFCEVDGKPGTGSSLSAHGIAMDEGLTILIAIDRFQCANGAPGANQPPIYLSAEYAAGLLDFGDGFLATRIGTP